MAKFLRSDTAAHIMFGPFVDKTDGVTLEVAAGIVTSIDHATTGIFLSKNGAAGAIRNQVVTTSVLDAYGMFQVHLDIVDTNTPGTLRVMMAEAATFLPVHDDYMVIPHELWDTLFVTQPCAAINKFFDKATPTGTVNSLPDAVPGQNLGLPTTNGTKVSQTVDLTAAQSIACSDKTGFSLSATGADLILKTSTFAVAIAAAINELATYGLTALNTLLVTTGIKAATVPTVVLANSASHGGAASVITLLTPIAATVPNTQKVDVETIKTQAVTCAAAVTVLPSVGAASAQTATLDTIKAETAAILVDTGTTLDGRIPAALAADGFMKASLFGAMGTALTETAGLIAAAIVKFFNIATPTGTVNEIKANVKKVNDVTLTGDGSATPWGPV